MQKVFAKVGQSLQQVGGNCPEGWAEIDIQRPEPHYVCQALDGVAVWVEPEDTRDYKHFTGQEKLDLFTEQEQAAIIGAAYAGDIDVAMVYERFKVADYLTYSDPKVEAGLSLLVEKGKVSPERKLEITFTMTASRQQQ